jgi:hypothetical protein
MRRCFIAGEAAVTLKDEHPTDQDSRKSLGASVEDNQNQRYWAGACSSTCILMIQLVLMSANQLISNILSLDAKPCAWLHCFGKKDHGFSCFSCFSWLWDVCQSGLDPWVRNWQLRPIILESGPAETQYRAQKPELFIWRWAVTGFLHTLRGN